MMHLKLSLLLFIFCLQLLLERSVADVTKEYIGKLKAQ